MFITRYHPSADRDVYGYFSNVKGESQTYIIRPGTLFSGTFTGTNAEVHCISVQQLYSISGSAEFFLINDFYDNCSAPAPAYSLGYFVFSYSPSLKQGELVDEFQIFPNPASTFFTIQQTDVTLNEIT